MDDTLQDKSTHELLGQHVQIGDELRRRGVLRTANTPTGDYAEHLFCRACNWEQEQNSKRGFDATDNETGLRYQIKARRLHSRNKSRKLSAIRNLKSMQFDYLAGILFGENYNIFRAALVPFAVVLERATFSAHINGHFFQLRDEIWDLPDVKDVTAKIKAAI